MPTLDECVIAYHRRASGHKHKPEHCDFCCAVAEDPELLNAAMAEKRRLESIRGLFDRDYVSKMRHAALSRMIAETQQK
jgi:hypothetical protein